MKVLSTKLVKFIEPNCLTHIDMLICNHSPTLKKQQKVDAFRHNFRPKEEINLDKNVLDSTHESEKIA